MKKLFSTMTVFLLSLMIVLSVVGCSQPNSSPSSEGDSQSNSVSEETSDSTGDSTASSSVAEFVPATLKVLEPNFTQLDDTSYDEATRDTTLFLVGDSTVCEYTATSEKNNSYYYMRNGYGMRLSEYLNGHITIRNLALGGRSSKSFTTEKNYQTLKDEIKAGDYLLIGFGHNDEKKESARYTNPVADVTDETSFKYYLYEYYIKVALDAGATPILCTPIVRRSANGTYSGSNIHVTTTSGAYVGGDYSAAIKELGEEKNVTVIDLTTLTKELLTGVSSDESASIYSWQYTSNKLSTTVDNTHINAYGAQIVARMFAETLLKTNCSLKNYVNKTFAVPNADVLVPIVND
jgi:lysophospholipase L1-like esterase